MDEANLNFIVNNLIENKCVIFIGPEIVIEDGVSAKSKFYKKVASENPDKVLFFNEAEELFLFADGDTKADIQEIVKAYHKKDYGKDILEIVAKLPFNVTINVVPDLTLKNIFVEQKIPHIFDYFERENRRNLNNIPTFSNPLIYNIFGNVQKDETLILAHDDLFLFLRDVLIEDRLPEELRDALKKAKAYIFIGFQFDKWYVQLLLRLFGLDNKERSFKRFAIETSKNKDYQTVCTKDFKIQFFDTNSKEIVTEIFEKVKQLESDGKKYLRQANTDNYNSNNDPLKFANQERKNQLEEQLKRLEKLRSDYETKQILEQDPIQLMDIENKLKMLVNKINEIRNEFVKLSL